MSKGLLTIIIIACGILLIGSLGYSIYNYITTTKRNKAAEKANERLFLAETQKILDAKNQNGTQTKNVPTYIANPIIKEEHKPLDYDNPDDEIVETDKKLKDFFKAN